MSKLSYLLASPPEEDELVAELSLEGREFGHITQKDGEFVLAIYHGVGDFDECPLSEFLAVVDEVKLRLASRR